MVLTSVGLSLVVAEIALRVVGFQFLLYPTKVQFGWPDPVTLHNSYRFDRELLWVPKDYPSRIAAGASNRPTIVFMGDSCTEYGRYDLYLEQILRANDPDSGFTSVNVGVGGWSSYQGLQQLKRDVLPMKPRVAMIYYGWNDHWVSFGIEDKKIGDFNLKNRTLAVTLSSRSRVLQLVNRAIIKLKQSGQQDGRSPVRVSLEDFRSNLVEMTRIARQNGITPILLTAPSSHRRGEEPEQFARRWLHDLSELVPLHRKYVQAVRDVSEQEQVLLVDLFAKFDQLPQEDLEVFFKDDGLHLTDEGDRKVAEFVHEDLLKAGVVF